MTDSQRHKLNLLAKRFEEWLAALHYSPKTRVNYSRDVRGFLEWIAGNLEMASIAEVTPAHLQQYQMALYNHQRPAAGDGTEKRLSVGSQACRLAAVRKFFAWLLADQQIATNPASSLQMPQQRRRLPRNILTRSEARRLIEATPIKKPRDIRDRALLELLYATGIRRAELIELNLYDLDLEAGTLRVHGKGDATRLVPLTTSAKAALQLYLEEARPIFCKACSVSREPRTTNPEPRLFVSSRSGGPLDDADIVRIVAKAARRAKISKHITPHTLRHYVARRTMSRDEGCDSGSIWNRRQKCR
jgi:integrase/recombinase XerD